MHLSTLSPPPPNDNITAIRLREIVCDIHSDRNTGKKKALPENHSARIFMARKQPLISFNIESCFSAANSRSAITKNR